MWFVLAARGRRGGGGGGGGGGVFMICLVRGGACVWFRGEAGGC